MIARKEGQTAEELKSDLQVYAAELDRLLNTTSLTFEEINNLDTMFSRLTGNIDKSADQVRKKGISVRKETTSGTQPGAFDADALRTLFSTPLDDAGNTILHKIAQLYALRQKNPAGSAELNQDLVGTLGMHFGELLSNYYADPRVQNTAGVMPAQMSSLVANKVEEFYEYSRKRTQALSDAFNSSFGGPEQKAESERYAAEVQRLDDIHQQVGQLTQEQVAEASAAASASQPESRAPQQGVPPQVWENLHKATLSTKDIEALERYLSKNPFNKIAIEESTGNNFIHYLAGSALFDAASTADSISQETSLGAGVDLFAKNLAGKTPLDIALEKGNIEFINKLKDMVLDYKPSSKDAPAVGEANLQRIEKFNVWLDKNQAQLQALAAPPVEKQEKSVDIDGRVVKQSELQLSDILALAKRGGGQAGKYNDKEFILDYFSEHPEQINTVLDSATGDTILHLVARLADSQTIDDKCFVEYGVLAQDLCARGANPTIQNIAGETAVSIAQTNREPGFLNNLTEGLHDRNAKLSQAEPMQENAAWREAVMKAQYLGPAVTAEEHQSQKDDLKQRAHAALDGGPYADSIPQLQGVIDGATPNQLKSITKYIDMSPEDRENFETKMKELEDSLTDKQEDDPDALATFHAAYENYDVTKLNALHAAHESVKLAQSKLQEARIQLTTSKETKTDAKAARDAAAKAYRALLDIKPSDDMSKQQKDHLRHAQLDACNDLRTHHVLTRDYKLGEKVVEVEKQYERESKKIKKSVAAFFVDAKHLLKDAKDAIVDKAEEARNRFGRK